MSKKNSKYNPVFKPMLTIFGTAFALLVLQACGGKSSSQSPDGPKLGPPPVVFDSAAKPTLVIPETKPGTAPYVAPESVTNTYNVNKPVTITLGKIRLTDARIAYSSFDKKISVTGKAAIIGSNNEKLREKSFNLTGYHDEAANFKVYDEVADNQNDPQKMMKIRGQAVCMQTFSDESLDCTHVVVDIFVSYQGQIYSEQVEVNNNLSELNNPNANLPPPQVGAPSDNRSDDATLGGDPDDGTDDQKEDQDQGETDLQPEGSDDSIAGRYEGPAQNIDLDDLFADAAAPASVDPTKPAPIVPVPSAPPPRATPPTPVAPAPVVPAPVAPKPKPKPKPTPAPAPKPPSPAPAPRTPAPRVPVPVPKPTPVVRPTPPAPLPPQKPVVVPRERPISPDLTQTNDGTVRPVNQAIGYPDQGRLRNATSLLSKQQNLGSRAFFEVVAPGRQRHFATFELSEMIARSGNLLNQRYSKKLFVSSAAARNGGKLSPHASHQMGTDVDLGYPSDTPGMKFPLVVKKSTRAYYPRNYSVEKTYNVFKFMFSQRDIKVDRIFVDDKIKAALCTYARSARETSGTDKAAVNKMFEALQHVKGHGDHFHLRLHCSASDNGCRSRVYRKMTGCQ